MGKLGKLELGDSVAEHDKNLNLYFVQTDYYNDAFNFRCKKSYFIGRKGVGKSAILEMIRQKNDSNKIININPDDFALRVLSESDLLKSLAGYNLEVVYKHIWKFVITVEILKKRFGTQRSWPSYIPWLTDNKVYKFLSECGEIGTINLSMGERLLKILERLKVSLKAQGFDVQVETKPGQEKLSELEIFREINNFAKELPKLLKGHTYYVLIDDLDIEWKNLPIQNEFLRALFKGIFKLQGIENLKFVVSLRQDIFSRLSIEDSDKIRDYIHYIKWDRAGLKEMIENRLQTALKLRSKDIWYQVFKKELFNKDSFDYIVERTLGYPRDVVQITQACVRRARDNYHGKVEESDYQDAQNWFSTKKIEDVANEFKSIYPHIDVTLNAFYGKSMHIKYREIEDILIDLVERDKEAKKLSWILEFLDEPGDFIKLLIKIQFLQYRSHHRELFLSGEENVPRFASDKFQYKIHPCFYAALHCTG